MLTHTRPRPRAGLIAVALATVAAILLAFSSVASAADSNAVPRQGYYCGFTTTSTNFGWQEVPKFQDLVSSCSSLTGEAAHAFGLKNPEPITFQIRYQEPHFYLDNLHWGVDSLLYIHGHHFGAGTGPFSASQNGHTLAGVFPNNRFFVGTLQHHNGAKVHTFAWFVGRTCTKSKSDNVVACTA